MAKHSFKQYWLAEAIRLREEHDGPLDDTSLLPGLRQSAQPLDDKILQRASLLSNRNGLTKVVKHWTSAARFALLILLVFAVLAGVGSTLSALDSTRNHINILVAIALILGLHAISYVVWLIALFAPFGSHTVLGSIWMWLSQKMARSPDTALAVQALISTLNRHRALRWVLSTVSHGVWLVILLSACLCLLSVLSAKSFSFGWETTILSHQTFVHLTHGLGFIPSLLGFPTPDADMIRASANQITFANEAPAIWSAWLLGQIVVWGILVRLISFIVCYVKAHAGLRQMSIDTSLPVYSSLIQRLQPRAENIGIDQTAPQYHHPSIQTAHSPVDWSERRLMLGLELAPEESWPIVPIGAHVIDAGVIQTREQRNTLLEQLHHSPVRAILIVCDARQTPDRGALRMMATILELAQERSVFLLHSQAQARLSQWKQALSALGLAPDHIFTELDQLQSWNRQ